MYGSRFKDEPRQDGLPEATEEAKPFEVKTYTPPTEAGFYWVNIPEHIRPGRDGKNPPKAKGKWNGIANIYGVAPYLKMKIWDIASHATSFGNAPHLIEYGPAIDLPEGAIF